MNQVCMQLIFVKVVCFQLIRRSSTSERIKRLVSNQYLFCFTFDKEMIVQSTALGTVQAVFVIQYLVH